MSGRNTSKTFGKGSVKRWLSLGIVGIGLTVGMGRFAPSATAQEAGRGNAVSQDMRLSAVADPHRHRSEAELRAYALQLVNKDRQAHGLPPLVADPVADMAAQRHAEDMLRRKFFDHKSPEGTKPRNRYQQAGGSPYGMFGENIFWLEHPNRTGLSFELANFLQQGWMHSPGHKEVITTKDFKGFGYGIVYAPGGQIYAVQVFSAPYNR
jgi:uncharacterized protein YkwD